MSRVPSVSVSISIYNASQVFNSVLNFSIVNGSTIFFFVCSFFLRRVFSSLFFFFFFFFVWPKFFGGIFKKLNKHGAFSVYDLFSKSRHSFQKLRFFFFFFLSLTFLFFSSASNDFPNSEDCRKCGANSRRGPLFRHGRNPAYRNVY